MNLKYLILRSDEIHIFFQYHKHSKNIFEVAVCKTQIKKEVFGSL
jgi:hypothetical protein